jgi:hypothetical protein
MKLTDETKPEDFKNPGPSNYSHIKGWGIDADPENDPTYPMKPNRTDEEQLGRTWERPPLQPVDVEILKSVERPNLTAVFGTSTPPSGLSGMLRRVAFKYSESSYGRWLPLVLADRIGAVEGILQDLSRGHIPNIPAERGWTAEWKYNRKNFLVKVGVGVIVTGAVIALVASSKKKKKAGKFV